MTRNNRTMETGGLRPNLLITRQSAGIRVVIDHTEETPLMSQAKGLARGRSLCHGLVARDWG